MRLLSLSLSEPRENNVCGQRTKAIDQTHNR